jgi:phospholipid/cholesterol/gamma-HCH transport system permease protein
LTAGVDNATATETEGNGLPVVDVVVDVDVDVSTLTVAKHVSDHVAETTGTREGHQVPAEPPVGGQTVTMLGKSLRYARRQLDSSLQTLGRFFDLAAQAFMYLITDLIRFRHPWRDTVNQAWFIISVTAIPALLVSIPFGVIVAVQVGSFIQQVGASSVSGAAGGLEVIRQGAPVVAALLLGGAAGSAVATDLGARTIREEVDALRVMGIDPVQ